MPAISRRAAVSVQPLPVAVEERAAGRRAARTRARGSRGRAPSSRTSGNASKTRIARSWPVEELAEVGLAQPAVDVRAGLDADDGRDRARARQPRREIGLAEAALRRAGRSMRYRSFVSGLAMTCWGSRSALPRAAREAADIATVVALVLTVIDRNLLFPSSLEHPVAGASSEPGGSRDQNQPCRRRRRPRWLARRARRPARGVRR